MGVVLSGCWWQPERREPSTRWGRTMRADRAAVLAVALALVCMGCGSAGGHSSSSAKGHGDPRPATSASAAPAAIGDVRGRLLTSRALRGFTPLGRRQVGTSAASWATMNQLPAGEATRLERLGFVVGGREDLIGPDRRAGLSMVEGFRSRAGARDELVNLLRGLVQPGAKAFAVPGVPGARGYYAVGSGINAAFADGAFCYLVGAEEPAPGTPGGTSRASLVTAVQRLYRRVH